MSDPALDALLYPFGRGTLSWPVAGEILFRGARPGLSLLESPRPRLACEQGFKPLAEALEAQGLRLQPADPERRWPLILLLPPRQREAARAALARSLLQLAPGGRLVSSAPNSEGAQSLQSDLQQLSGRCETLSKHKCRVLWTAQGFQLDRALAAQWAVLDEPRPILQGRFLSRPGLFAWDRIDPASALLVEQLPDDIDGSAADFGAGWGFLSASLLQRGRRLQSLDLFEADAAALELAQRNLDDAGLPVRFHWHDVSGGVPGRFNNIVCNPPFHAGRADRPELGQAFIRAASAALLPGGRLWLVANRHLPYEATLTAAFGTCRVLAQRDGFKVFEARQRG